MHHQSAVVGQQVVREDQRQREHPRLAPRRAAPRRRAWAGRAPSRGVRRRTSASRRPASRPSKPRHHHPRYQQQADRRDGPMDGIAYPAPLRGRGQTPADEADGSACAERQLCSLPKHPCGDHSPRAGRAYAASGGPVNNWRTLPWGVEDLPAGPAELPRRPLTLRARGTRPARWKPPPSGAARAGSTQVQGDPLARPPARRPRQPSGDGRRRGGDRGTRDRC